MQFGSGILSAEPPVDGDAGCVALIAHNLARWTARIGLGEQLVTTKTLRRRFFSLTGRLTRSARRLTLHLPQGWPWENQFSRWHDSARCLSRPDGARLQCVGVGVSPLE